MDTNILIRALIKPQGTVGPIIRRLRVVIIPWCILRLYWTN
ncbi:MAG TPA: hypothetical protein VGX03_00080 [Candidatus Binatia bacterium]|nr:hypothetical protein [Candidatus Binatia bacterium]